MSDIQAALLNAQLDRVADFWRRRSTLVGLYDEALAGERGLLLMARRDYVRPAHHLYVVRITPEAGLTRDEFMNAVQADGVGVGVHFRAVHLHPYYRETFGFRAGMFPVAEAAGESVVSLPLYPSLSERKLERVVDVCTTVLRSA